MAVFNELIKNYDKIREYLRDFTIYGYKYRSDFDQKSRRSYDNERRRIENYLSDYVQKIDSIEGRKICIESGALLFEDNPLFCTWQTKSFTKNDVMLHFLIIDILKTNNEMTAKDLLDKLLQEYLSRFNDIKVLDLMTIRNKLNEYTDIGIIKYDTIGRSKLYSLVTNSVPIENCNIHYDLLFALKYFQNILPMGILGYFYKELITKNIVKPIFSFRHQFFAHTIDDDYVLTLFQTITKQRYITISLKTRDNGMVQSIKILPLQIINNLSTGRRYLVAYLHRKGLYKTYRIDKIVDIALNEQMDRTKNHKAIMEYKLNNSWAVSIKNTKPNEVISMDILVEKSDEHVVNRLKREGRHGTLIHIGNRIYNYSIEISDANEMIPWLRTFIGRIVSFECSNKRVEKCFLEDIQHMYDMYKED